MMTKEQMRKMLIEFISIILVTVILLFVGTSISAEKASERLSLKYSQEFYALLPAASYEEVLTPILNHYGSVNHAYEAFDSEGNVIGFVMDVTIINEANASIHLLQGIDSNSLQVTGIRRVHDEANPLFINDSDIDLVTAQLSGRQIPVALNSQRESTIVVDDTVELLSGLNDGTYFAQRQYANRNGYIDYVEMDIENGVITRVLWDAFNVDPTTPDRREASLTGAYTVSGETWATQSYNLCHALMDLQNPSRLAMKSDGTTEIIDGVTIDIRDFVELCNECIANSRAGYDKEDYYAGMDYVFTNLFSMPASDLGLINGNGFVVYSFSDYPNLFKVYDEDGEVAGELNVREYEEFYSSHGEGELPSSDDITAPVEIEEEATPVPTAPVYSDGSEDGIVIGFDSADLTANIDGLPMSEIRTFIDGAPANQDGCAGVVSSINISYRFVREFLNLP